MLFKWLVLAIVAWYVYKAGRNLLLVATGRAEEPLVPPAPPPRPAPQERRRIEADVEDARYTDL